MKRHGEDFHLRDVHGGIGEAEVGGNLQTSFDHLALRVREVLNVSTLGFNGVSGEVRDLWNVRMRGFTMITLVVVVGQNLPVPVALHVPRVVVPVVVEVVVIQPLLLVDDTEVILPCDLRLLTAIQVDPNETALVDVDMDGQKAVLALVEFFELASEFTGFGELAVDTICPAMILALEDARVSCITVHDRVSTVSAVVVKRVHITLTISTNHERETSDIATQPIS